MHACWLGAWGLALGPGGPCPVHLSSLTRIIIGAHMLTAASIITAAQLLLLSPHYGGATQPAAAAAGGAAAGAAASTSRRDVAQVMHPPAHLNLLFPTNLTVEYLPMSTAPQFAPLVDTARPRFSWQLASRDPSVRNQVQQGFQILVRQLMPDGTEKPVSDSYQVWSSESIHQPLACDESASGCGTELARDATYSVRVRVWSAIDGVPAQRTPPPSINYSHPVYFGTPLGLRPAPGAAGLPAHWAAPWITAPTQRNQLRLAFELPTSKNISHARVYAATAGYSAIFLNGARVHNGGDELGPWTSWGVRVLYRGYDVSARLRPGPNLLGVWLGRGQYGGAYQTGRNYWQPQRDARGMPLPHELPRSCTGCSALTCLNRTQPRTSNDACPPLGLRLQLNVVFTDGSTAVIKNISQWRASIGPITWNDVYEGESFDNRLFDPHWTEPSVSSRGAAVKLDWLPVQQLPPNAPTTNATLSLHQYTPIRSIGKRFPARLTTAGVDAEGNTVHVYHFRTNFVGYSALHGVNLPKGTVLTLSHGEQLICGGKPALVNCSGGDIYYPFAKVPQQDNFTVAGVGNETFRPYFTYHGYQFVSLRGWPRSSPGPTLQTLSGTIVHSDNKRIAQLTFPKTQGGALLASINDAAVRSLLSNHHSVESDCPTRERVGWTGDSQATAESAFRALSVGSFYTKWMVSLSSLH
jgi:hypothetical protein